MGIDYEYDDFDDNQQVEGSDQSANQGYNSQNQEPVNNQQVHQTAQPQQGVNAEEAQNWLHKQIQEGVQNALNEGGYQPVGIQEATGVAKQHGFSNLDAADRYYAGIMTNVMHSPQASQQQKAEVENIVGLWNNPATKSQAIEKAVAIYGKPPDLFNQNPGQTQSFGHQPGVRQQVTGKPFNSQEEFEAAFYDSKHPKYAQAQKINAQMASGKVTDQEIPWS